MPDGVRVVHTNEKGRHLVAERAFQVGDVVVQQLPYAAVLFEENLPHFCNYCFQPGKELKRCSRSKFAHYCCREHQIEDWKEGDYKKECDFIVECAPRVPPASVRLAAHVAWKRNRELEDRMSSENMWDGYDGVDALMDHWDRLPGERMKSFAEMGLFITKICPHLPEEGLSLDEPAPKSFARLFAKFAFNNHTVSCSSVTSLGCGVYPLLAMANHSSTPNCIQRFNGKLGEFRAIRHISAGEEISITYVDLMSTTLEVHEILKKDYLFDLLPSWNEGSQTRSIQVDHTLSVTSWKKERPPWIATDKDMHLTEISHEEGESSCGAIVVVHLVDGAELSEWETMEDDAPNRHNKNETKHVFTVHLWGEWVVPKQFDAALVAKRMRAFQQTYLDAQQSYHRKQYEEALKLAVHAKEMCSEAVIGTYALGSSHILRIRILDLIRQAVVDVGTDWKLALDCYRSFVQKHDILFPTYWSERGSQLAALARLESNYGELENAMRVATEALHVLRITDGSGDVLEEMKKLEKALHQELHFRHHEQSETNT